MSERSEKTMLDLIERLEKCEGPDRELDGDIFAALGMAPEVGGGPFDWRRDEGGTYGDAGSWRQSQFNQPVSDKRITAPQYTKSLDAALTLVPEGCAFKVRRNLNLQDCWAVIQKQNADGEARPHWVIFEESPMCATPAIALVTAALRARMSIEDGGEA